MKQEEEYTSNDADEWYLQNKEDLENKTEEKDNICNAINAIELKPKQILEIGCSCGYRLKWLFNRFNAECFGLDPSEIAITDGKKNRNDITLQVGYAKSLPFENNSFDLIIFGFCLYVCPRKDLFKVISEADRVLQDMGHIVIEDFYPPFPFKNKYKKKETGYSYKMDYSELFVCNPAYTASYRIVTTQQGLKDVSNPNERISAIILQKDSISAYPENPFKKQTEQFNSGDAEQRAPD